MVPVAVLRSTDNGDSWQPVNNRLITGNGINALIATVNAIFFRQLRRRRISFKR